MSISLPTINLPPTPRALVDILRLEGGPSALPVSSRLAAVSLVAYGAGEIAQQLLAQEMPPAVVYGLLNSVLLTALAAVVVFAVGKRDRFLQTLTALAAMGAIVAFATVVLYSFVSLVFPAPLPTMKLVGFLLFPLVLWKVTLFTWIFRHASVRVIPAFAISAIYVGITAFILAPLIARIFERFL